MNEMLINPNGGGGVKYSLYKEVTISDREKGDCQC